MPDEHRFPREAWVPIAAGLVWLWCAASFGVLGFLFSLIPGCLLLASGVSTLLYPGDLRIPQFSALGGVLGVLLAPPALFVEGFWTAFLLVGLSAASFVAAGLVAVRQEIRHEDVPDPEPSLRLGAEVAADEALLATMTLTLPHTDAGDLPRLRREVHAARELLRDRGWLEKPADFHLAPPPPRAARDPPRPHARPRLRAAALRERLRAARRGAGARKLAASRGEPHGPRLGAAPERSLEAVAGLHPRLPDGLPARSTSPLSRPRSCSARGG